MLVEIAMLIVDLYKKANLVTFLIHILTMLPTLIIASIKEVAIIMRRATLMGPR